MKPLLFAAVVLFAMPAAAFDSRACNLEGGDCDGVVAAHSPWVAGEHATIWLRTRDLSGLPAAVDAPFTVRTAVGNARADVFASFQGQPLNQAVDVQTRIMEVAVFAQLPDFSYALWDWAAGNESCPPADSSGFAECHEFLNHMGWLNSNHFLPQAGQAFARYHGLALSRALECQRLGTTLSMGQREEPELLQACDREALVLEAVGHHYLQDAWSMGHMWQRWASPDLADLSTTVRNDPSLGTLKAVGEAVGLASGIVHGAQAITGFQDAMCAPSEGVEFRHGSAPISGAGDLYLNQVSTDEALGPQRARLDACGATAMREVYLASSQSLGPVLPSQTNAMVLEDCFTQRATNRAIGLGAAIQFPRTLVDGFFFPPSGVSRASDAYLAALGVTAIAPDDYFIPLTSELLTSLSGFLNERLFDATVVPRWHEDMSGIQDQLRRLAAGQPDDTTLADGAMGPLLGMQPNGFYSAANTSYGDPPLPWVPSRIAVPTEARAGTAANLLARTFSVAHTADWCGVMTKDGTDEFSLNRLRDRCVTPSLGTTERAAACSICKERAAPHARKKDISSGSVKDALCPLLRPDSVTLDVPADAANAWLSDWCDGPVVLKIKTADRDAMPDSNITVVGNQKNPAERRSIHLAADGSIEITGEVPVYHCSDSVPDELVVTLADVEVARIPAQGGVFAAPGARLPVPPGGAALMEAARLVQISGTWPLVFKHASACLGAPETVAMVEVNFTVPPCTVCCYAASGYCGCDAC
jgi:hypothetical protein